VLRYFGALLIYYTMPSFQAERERLDTYSGKAIPAVLDYA